MDPDGRFRADQSTGANPGVDEHPKAYSDAMERNDRVQTVIGSNQSAQSGNRMQAQVRMANATDATT